MSGVAYQTGTHHSGAHTSGNGASGNWDEFSEFPRFLGRDGAERTANMPPPLPRAAWYMRVHWMIRRTAPRRLAALAAALVVLVPAATALVIDTGPLQLNVIQVTSIEQPKTNVADDLESLAALEARLRYGTNLALINDPARFAQTLEQSVSDQYAEATLPPTDPVEPSDTPALLILRNLPENVTFTSGERSGKGEWVMAAGDPNQLDMTLGEGFDDPVAADVELVSHAGLTLGLLHLELRRNVAAIAEAQAATAPPGPVSLSDAEKAEPKSEVTEPKAKPRKRALRATTRRNPKFARADGGYIKRIKKPDRWKTETVEASDGAGNQNNADAATEAPVDETAKGPISKFFSWIAGGGTSTAPGNATDETKATLFPQ